MKVEYVGKVKDIVILVGEEGLLVLVVGLNVVCFMLLLIILEVDIEVGL